MAIAYILIFIVCVLLVLFVLVQNSKGGGLAAGFTGSQVMGVRKTADFLEKATWTLAGTLILICIIVNIINSKGGVQTERSVLEEETKNAISTNSQPRVPTATKTTTEKDFTGTNKKDENKK
jgi:preprotein translocase subunit SecG